MKKLKKELTHAHETIGKLTMQLLRKDAAWRRKLAASDGLWVDRIAEHEAATAHAATQHVDTVARLESLIAEHVTVLAGNNGMIAERDAMIAKQDSTISERNREIALLRGAIGTIEEKLDVKTSSYKQERDVALGVVKDLKVRIKDLDARESWALEQANNHKRALDESRDAVKLLKARITELEGENAEPLVTFNVWRDMGGTSKAYTLRKPGHMESSYQCVGTAQARKTDKHASAWQADIAPGIAFAIVRTDDVYEIVSVTLHENAETTQPGRAPEIAEAPIISMPIWHNPDSDMYTVSPTDNVAHHVKVGTANVRLIDENLEGWSVKMWSDDLLIIGVHFRHETSMYEIVSVHEDAICKIAEPHDVLALHVYRLHSDKRYFVSETDGLEKSEPCDKHGMAIAREIFGDNFEVFQKEMPRPGMKMRLSNDIGRSVVIISEEDA